MPELPDVEYVRRYLDSTSLHRPIAEATVLDSDLAEETGAGALETRLEGASFEESDRHGKYMFVQVGDVGWLILHYGMSGTLDFWKSDREPPEHTALLVDFEDGSHLAYVCTRRLGEIGWTEDPQLVVAEKELGPDVLSKDFDADRFLELLDGRGGYLKSALMDQQLMAGIGNVYSDEILFQSRLHPQTQVADLDERQRLAVYETLQPTLAAFVEHLPDLDELSDEYMLPHRHEDGRCPRGGTELQRVEVIGRSAYFCPECQPEPS